MDPNYRQQNLNIYFSAPAPPAHVAGREAALEAHVEDNDDVDDSCDAVPLVPTPTLTESQALKTALRRSSKYKPLKFQDELPESCKTIIGSMSHKCCCDAHAASTIPVVSNPVETQSHFIDSQLAEHAACREAPLSPRACPTVLSPDSTHRHKDQASWPDVPTVMQR